jgi:hypothetical protein
MHGRKPTIPLVSDPEASTSLTSVFFLKAHLNISPVIYGTALQALLISHSACKSVGLFIDSSSTRMCFDPNAERTQQGCV